MILHLLASSLLLVIATNAASVEQITYKVVQEVSPTNLTYSRSFPTPPHCLLPSDKGHGNDQILSWFFDHESGQCEQFHYLGQEGNLNRFESEFECLINCTGDPCRPVQIGGSQFGALMVNGRFQQCEYNGLSRNDNCPHDYYCSQYMGVCCRQETQNVCALPKMEGEKPSEHSERRRFFYYNQQSNACESFQFNGVGGNQNRFETKSQCELACVKPSCPDGRPYNKMRGPVHCSLHDEDFEGVCPDTYNCVQVGQNLNYCCQPNTLLPTDDQRGSMQGSVSAASLAISTSVLASLLSVFLLALY